MRKKLLLTTCLLTTCLLTLSTAPTQAYPVWAKAVAQSQCEYLAMGAEWEESLEKALWDNIHWIEEMSRNEEQAGHAIAYAAYKTCPDIFMQAFRRHEQKSK